MSFAEAEPLLRLMKAETLDETEKVSGVECQVGRTSISLPGGTLELLTWRPTDKVYAQMTYAAQMMAYAVTDYGRTLVLGMTLHDIHMKEAQSPPSGAR